MAPAGAIAAINVYHFVLHNLYQLLVLESKVLLGVTLSIIAKFGLKHLVGILANGSGGNRICRFCTKTKFTLWHSVTLNPSGGEHDKN